MRQVSDLAGWPPKGGSGPYDTRATDFANFPERVIVRRVDRVVANRVDITCMFDTGIVTFRFFASDPGTAQNMAGFLELNRGQSLQYIGELTAPES